MKHFVLILMILLISGCRSRKQEYLVIQYWYAGKNLIVMLNSKPIDCRIKDLYLNPRNIKRISLTPRQDTVFIEQKNTNAKLLYMKDLDLEDLSKNKISRIVFNEKLTDEDQFKKIIIEEKAIKSFEIIKSYDLHGRDQNNGVLIIQTK